MKAIVEINMESRQARELVNFIETLPFAKIQKDKSTDESIWKQAVDEGAIPLDEFDTMFKEEIHKVYNS